MPPLFGVSPSHSSLVLSLLAALTLAACANGESVGGEGGAGGSSSTGTGERAPAGPALERAERAPAETVPAETAPAASLLRAVSLSGSRRDRTSNGWRHGRGRRHRNGWTDWFGWERWQGRHRRTGHHGRWRARWHDRLRRRQGGRKRHRRQPGQRRHIEPAPRPWSRAAARLTARRTNRERSGASSGPSGRAEAAGCLITYGSSAAFSATWNNSGDFLARVGLNLGSNKTYDQFGTIAADFAETKSGSGGGYSSIGVYGWSVSPLVEWYVTEDSYNGLGSSGTKKGTFTIDGEGTYNVYQRMQNNQPSIQGTASFPSSSASAHQPAPAGTSRCRSTSTRGRASA